MSISVLTKGMSCLFFCFCVCCMNAQVRNTDPVRHLRISGYLGQRIDACIEYRVKAQDVEWSGVVDGNPITEWVYR